MEGLKDSYILKNHSIISKMKRNDSHQRINLILILFYLEARLNASVKLRCDREVCFRSLYT